MCGIYGMAGKSDRGLLEAMCSSLEHRGPDDKGTYVEPYAAIGSCRLSVIDIQGGHQPISNEDGSLRIVFNGEIYNYPEIRETLKKRGHIFRTNSDTEVIVHAYEQYGEDCVCHFNGDFAFAMWNTKSQEMFCARDRIGVKPFYYWHNGPVFLFGSEIKAILQDKNIKRSVDILSLYNYLSRLSVWGDSTIFEGVKSLPPAHTLRFKNGRLSIKRYWDFDFSNQLKVSEEEYAEAIYDSFCKSVKRRLIADVPLGAFLSGGVDSSSIVAVMSELTDKPVKTFSFGFNADNTNVLQELGYAREVANYFGTDHHEFVLDAEKLISELPHLIWHFDSPFAGTLPQYFISDQSSKHVKVVLCGSGGDELFGDYGRSWRFGRYLDNRVLQYSNWSYPMKHLFAKATRYIPNVGKMKYIRHRANDIVKKSRQRGMMYVDGLDAIFTSNDKNDLCRPWMLEMVKQKKSLADDMQDYFVESKAKELMDQVFCVNMKTQLVDEYCLWTDSLSMAASVEARVPFLDHEFIELVTSIPASIRSRKNDLKYLFRKAMKNHVPENVFFRPKGGLSLPFDDWLRNGLNSLAKDMLSEKQIEKRGYFNPKYVSKLLSEHTEQKSDHSYKLWSLIVFELWQRIYLDNYSFSEVDICSI